MSSLYILNIYPLSIHSLQLFFFSGCLFILLMVSVAVQTFFYLDVVPLVYFDFCCLCFMCHILKCITKIPVKEFYSCFLLGFSCFQVLTYLSLYFKLTFLSGVKTWDQSYSFTYKYPIFSALLLKGLSFLHPLSPSWWCHSCKTFLSVVSHLMLTGIQQCEYQFHLFWHQIL